MTWVAYYGGWVSESRSRWLRPPDGESACEVGLRNLSKMAMIKNMEMRMAVATNPNDTALTELSKCLKGSSLCTLSKGAPIGAHAYPSFSTIFLSCCFPFPSSQLRNLAGLHHVYVVLLGHSNAVSERQRERERERALDCTESCGST
jgi:hypothetical protein